MAEDKKPMSMPQFDENGTKMYDIIEVTYEDGSKGTVEQPTEAGLAKLDEHIDGILDKFAERFGEEFGPDANMFDLFPRKKEQSPNEQKKETDR